jgi:hypothetical protein
VNDSLRGGHESENAFSLIPKTSQIRSRVTEPEHPQPRDIGPNFAQPPANEPTGNLPQLTLVELVEIDDVGTHGSNATMLRFDSGARRGT